MHVQNAGRLKGRTAAQTATVVDAGVFRAADSIALSKADFAAYVHGDVIPFGKFDIKHFRHLFDVVERIIEAAKPKTSISVPSADCLQARLAAKPAIAHQ